MFYTSSFGNISKCSSRSSYRNLSYFLWKIFRITCRNSSMWIVESFSIFFSVSFTNFQEVLSFSRGSNLEVPSGILLLVRHNSSGTFIRRFVASFPEVLLRCFSEFCSGIPPGILLDTPVKNTLKVISKRTYGRALKGILRDIVAKILDLRRKNSWRIHNFWRIIWKNFLKIIEKASFEEARRVRFDKFQEFH